MHEFTPFERELEAEASGNRFGPPRKHTLAGLLDSPQFPQIRPRCFGCSEPLVVSEIGRHILNCDKVAAEDLVRFRMALDEFTANPGHAREVVEEFVHRVRLNYLLERDAES